MQKLVFKPNFLKPPVFIVAIVDGVLIYLFLSMDNFSIVGLIIGILLINGIALGAIYKSLYSVSLDDKSITITHALNSSDSLTVYFNEVTEIKIDFIYEIGHKIFFYKDKRLLHERNISSLSIFEIDQLGRHIANMKR